MKHRLRFIFRTFVLATVSLGTIAVAPARAQMGWREPEIESNKKPPALDGIGIDQNLNAQIPMDLVFNDESGQPVKLGELFHDRPVVLSLVYFQCPMLCTVVLNDMLRGFVGLPTLTIGKDYDVITVSFDPNETPKLAAQKKDRYVHEYGRGSSAKAGWHFLTGNAEAIKALTSTVGFKYRWDEASKQFIHPSGITVLNPDGKISKYFFGIDYEPTDLRLALVDAGQGKTGSITEHILLYCFHYDATTGKYGLAIQRGLKIFGAVFVIAMVSGIAFLLWKDKSRIVLPVTADR